jgi:hypothetical protein
MDMGYEEIQTKYQGYINTVLAKFEPEIEALKGDGESLEKDGGQTFKFDLELKWGEQRVSFDVPQVTMKTQRLSFDIPQVIVRDQEITFSTPSTRMVQHKIGEKPEFHGPKIVWTPIYIDIPEVFMEEQRFVVGIPEIKMETLEFSLDIPEVTMDRLEWVLKVPELRLGDVSVLIPVDQSDLKARGEALEMQGKDLSQRMQTEILTLQQEMQAEVNHAIGEEYAQKMTGAASPDAGLLQKFDEAIAQIDATLANSSNLPPDLVAQLTLNKQQLLDAKIKLHLIIVEKVSTSVTKENLVASVSSLTRSMIA